MNLSNHWNALPGASRGPVARARVRRTTPRTGRSLTKRWVGGLRVPSERKSPRVASQKVVSPVKKNSYPRIAHRDEVDLEPSGHVNSSSNQESHRVGESANIPRSPERGGWFTQATPPVSLTEETPGAGRYLFFFWPFFGIFVGLPGRRPSVIASRALRLFQHRSSARILRRPIPFTGRAPGARSLPAPASVRACRPR